VNVIRLLLEAYNKLAESLLNHCFSLGESQGLCQANEKAEDAGHQRQACTLGGVEHLGRDMNIIGNVQATGYGCVPWPIQCDS